MEPKELLLKFCWGFIQQKKETLSKRRALLQESLDSESKSSAGDKHETGRAMVQLEQEKLGQQQMELDKMQKVLQQVNLDAPTSKVGLGNLVQTSSASYFIAISAGVGKTDGFGPVYCISAGTPIAKLLLGKSQGDTFLFKGKEHDILQVL
ncbi:3-oxoacyl-ACP synthase [Flagellimonas myxillae]|uniref:3-oxoacyl-ACP synthase n=1 Tax=Flagellimonas myxillae TaxID=2942214 RepID=UPI00201EAB83|nr:3-oxoacyl-ACP synthase [Muricauda myxillae]MCL6266534.1 3-oxoacyl-ACP synthase [Muricauda myxillae]